MTDNDDAGPVEGSTDVTYTDVVIAGRHYRAVSSPGRVMIVGAWLDHPGLRGEGWDFFYRVADYVDDRWERTRDALRLTGVRRGRVIALAVHHLCVLDATATGVVEVTPDGVRAPGSGHGAAEAVAWVVELVEALLAELEQPEPHPVLVTALEEAAR